MPAGESLLSFPPAMFISSTTRIITNFYAQSPSSWRVIQEIYLEPFSISVRYLAEKMNVAASTLNRI